MRRIRWLAVLTALAVVPLAASCGKDDGDARRGAPPAPAASDAPAAPDAAVDDDALLAALVASAKSGAPLPAWYAKLPPRVSPTRVAVHAVHDHLLAVPGCAPDWDALVAAIGRLAEGDRTAVDAKALPVLLAAWRAWTPEERQAEARLAARYVRGLDLLRGRGAVDTTALAEVLRELPKAPPKSAALACVDGIRVVLVSLASPGDDVRQPVADAIREAQAAFEDVSWPGGLAPFAEIAAGRVAADEHPSLRREHLFDLAVVAYRESADALRAALVTYGRVAGAERAGDAARALDLATRAVEEVRAAGARGAELTEALRTHARIALAVGRVAAALASLDAMLAEIDASHLPPARKVEVEERRATALWLLGRFDEAVAAADAGVRAYAPGAQPDPDRENLRAELDEVAGRALVDAGRPADAAARFLAAGDRHDKLPQGGAIAAVDRLMAADAWVRAGRRDEARKIVDAILAAPRVQIALRAQASAVLRDLGDLDGADVQLTAAESQGGDAVREALVEERARLAAARGDVDTARRLFSSATKAAAKAGAAGPGAQRVGVALLDWARLEERTGDLPEAFRIADQATGILAPTPFAPDLDRARAFCIRLGRRLDVASVEIAAKERFDASPPGDAARADAAIDLSLIRLEQASRGDAKARARLAEVLDPAVHAVVRRLVPEMELPASPAVGGAVPASVAPRMARLSAAADVADGSAAALLALAANVPAEEPELRRWALRRAAARPDAELKTVDWAAFLDRWCGAAPTTSDALAQAVPAGSRFLAILPLGAKTLVVGATPGDVKATLLPGDLGIARFWDAVFVEPTPERLHADGRALANSADWLRAALSFQPGERLILAVPPPFGPLPGDLLVRTTLAGDRDLIDSREVGVVLSPADLVAAAARAAPPSPPFLRSPTAPLATRHAVIAIAPVDDASRARFAALFEDARKRGLDASAAVRDAKLALRKEWTPDPKRPRLPPWAAFALRGAP